VTGLEATLEPPATVVKQVTITDPMVRVALDTNQTLNFLSLLKTPATSAGATSNLVGQATEDSPNSLKRSGLGPKLGAMLRQALSSTTNRSGAEAGPKLAVDRITISNGVVQFRDQSVQPPAAVSLKQLNVDVSGISTEELKRADVHLTAKAEPAGPIEVSGKLNPLSKNAPTEVMVKFTEVDLSPTSPYSGKFLGYKLNRGKLGLQMEYQVSQRQLRAKNVVVLDQLTLGEKVASTNATKLPVKLGVALLKDRNGKIEIELPIEGNLDDPEFHYGAAILHVLGNLVTKLITSPFAALSGLFGGSSDEDVSFQEFAPGSAVIEAAGARKLETLVNGLYERPTLELKIKGSFDPMADADGLRRKKIEQKLRQEKWTGLRKSEQARMTPEQVPLSPQEYAAGLKEAYDAALKARPATNAPPGASGAGSGSPPLDTDKGASVLLQKGPPPAKSNASEMEQVVFASMPIAQAELEKLADARAGVVKQRILDFGKIDAARLSVAEPSNDETNRASRVFFLLE